MSDDPLGLSAEQRAFSEGHELLQRARENFAVLDALPDGTTVRLDYGNGLVREMPVEALR